MQHRDFIRVSLSEFKRRLSHWLDVAEEGATIEVTRHSHPAVRVAAAQGQGLHVGSEVGRPLDPLPAGHRFHGILELLADDREPDR